jgi:hypothetical protein
MVHLISNPGTKRSIMSATNQIISLICTIQTNAMKLIIGSITRAGLYRQEMLH